MDLAYLVRAGLGMPDYWHPHVDIEPGFLNRDLGLYPVTMDVKAEYPGELDEHGIPVVYWGPNGTAAPSPVNIILYGLGSHDAYLKTGNDAYLVQMQCVLRWMERQATKGGEAAGWPYEVDMPVHRLKAPWSSGIVQGFALSLLLRAYKQNLPGPWRELSYQAWKGFHAPIEEGGFRREIPEGTIFEEYPGPDLDCVFNGMCYALISLWEASEAGLIREARTDFEQGVKGLHALLPRFAHGQWSLYSLSACLKRPMLASPYYHRINGLLAVVVGQMSGERDFIDYGSRWLAADSKLRRIAMSLRIGVERFLAAPAMLQRDKSKRSASTV